MESDDEWITEKEDPCLPEDPSWLDIQECFQDDEGTSCKKRKRGPRNINAYGISNSNKKGKKKVGGLVDEDEDVVEVIEDDDDEEEEEDELDEAAMMDNDDDDDDDDDGADFDLEE